MRKLAGVVVLVAILAASLPAGATYGTVFVRDWRNMAACQCLTDVWFIAPAAGARLSPDGKLMVYEVVDSRLREKWGTDEFIGDSGLFIGPRELLMWVGDSSGRAPEGIDRSKIYWAFPTLGHVWSRDGRYIYYDVLVDPTYNSKDPYWETWRLDLDTGTAEKMPWVGRVVMDTSPDGRWVIVVQTYPSVPREEVPPYILTERDVIAIDMLTGREVTLVSRGMIRVGLTAVVVSFNEQGDRLAVPVRNQVLLFSFDGKNFTHYRTLTFDGLVSGAVWDLDNNYLIIQRDTAYQRISRFHDPLPKSELYWIDLRSGESGPLWPSNFSQVSVWMMPGTRTIAFDSQLGNTLQELSPYLMNLGKPLPPGQYTARDLVSLR